MRFLLITVFYNSGVYRSNNLGADWELQNDGMANDLDISEFAYNHITGQMFLATSDGVYRAVIKQLTLFEE